MERRRRQTRPSFLGSVAWYRKDFRLPDARESARLDRALRVGQLPRDRVAQRPPARRRTSAATCRSSSTCRTSRAGASTASSCASTTAARRATRAARPGEIPVPPGGWWNYGGLLREVSLRAVDRVDIEDVQVQPAALPALRGDGHGARERAQRLARHAARAADRPLRQNAARPRHAGDPARATADVRARSSSSDGRSCGRPGGRASTACGWPRRAAQGRGRAHAGRRLHAAHRHPHARASTAAASWCSTAARSCTSAASRCTRTRSRTGPVMDHADAQRDRRADEGVALDAAARPLPARSRLPGPRRRVAGSCCGRRSRRPTSCRKPTSAARSSATVALDQLRANMLANRNHPSVAAWSVGNEMASAAGRNQARTSEPPLRSRSSSTRRAPSRSRSPAIRRRPARRPTARSTCSG